MNQLVTQDEVVDLFGGILRSFGFEAVRSSSIRYELSVSFENDRVGVTVFVEQGSSAWVSVHEVGKPSKRADLKFVCQVTCGDDIADLVSRYSDLDVSAQLRESVSDLERCLPKLLSASEGDLLSKAFEEARRYNE